MAGFLSLSTTISVNQKGGLGVGRPKEGGATVNIGVGVTAGDGSKILQGAKKMRENLVQISVRGVMVTAKQCPTCGGKVFPVTAKHNCGLLCVGDDEDFAQMRTCFTCKREYLSHYGAKRCQSCVTRGARMFTVRPGRPRTGVEQCRESI